MGKIDSDLEKFRKGIDEIDEQIVELLAKRMEFSQRIGELKHSLNLPLFDPAREEALLRRLVALNKSPLLTPDMLRAIYKEILAASRRLQYPIRVAYLGPDWSYSHVAAINFFGQQADYRPCASISRVFDLVGRGDCEVGVVPVESSVEGSIGATMDFLLEYDLCIMRECYVALEYSLAGAVESLKEVKYVYGHPRSFNLCRKWISEHLSEVTFLECVSTSEAAELCRKKRYGAALCNFYAAHYYGLNVLAENVSDYPDAYTRFLVVGQEKAPPSGKDKTSIVFATHDTPGALYDSLEPFARKGINLVRIESRRSKLWSEGYLFFVDLEGHADSPGIKEALQEMQEIVPLIKVLGSYPEALVSRPIKVNKEILRPDTMREG